MNFRLLPILGIAASALLALKVLGLVLGISAVPVSLPTAQAQETPGQGGTGNTEAEAPANAGAATPPVAAGAAGDSGTPAAGADTDTTQTGDGTGVPARDPLEIGGSAAERAVLESLGKRREELNKQAGQLDLREKLLQATEERVQKRVDELKALQQQIEGAVDAQKKKEDEQVKGLVTMYENMKPKDAARIFDRLDLDILLKVVGQMKPRKMSAILAAMSPEAAERLTVAIASGPQANTVAPVADATPSSAQLPKIPSN